MVLWLVAVVCVAGLLSAGCSAREDAAKKEGNAAQSAAGQAAQPGGANPLVFIETSMGTIKAELWADKTPGTVKNFLRYVDEGFYSGLIFHRVIDGFMIQGGGFTPAMAQRPTHETIRNEARPDLRNDRGTLAMARTPDPHSASSQFFINLKDNAFLNQKAPTNEGFGYCAFGRVIEGMDVADKIAKVPVKPNETGEKSVPMDVVQIVKVSRAQ